MNNTNTNTNNIISNASEDVPRNINFMLNHVGFHDKVDKDIDYVRQQKEIIDESNENLYQRNQHNINLITNLQSSVNPFAMNMISNHGNKGFDYRDFPKEIEKDNEKYDPYIGYLHKNGLIGKNNSRYTTHYINIDSRYRNKKPKSNILK
jgi:hypothetical protein